MMDKHHIAHYVISAAIISTVAAVVLWLIYFHTVPLTLG